MGLFRQSTNPFQGADADTFRTTIEALKELANRDLKVSSIYLCVPVVEESMEVRMRLYDKYSAHEDYKKRANDVDKQLIKIYVKIVASANEEYKDLFRANHALGDCARNEDTNASSTELRRVAALLQRFLEQLQVLGKFKMKMDDSFAAWSFHTKEKRFHDSYIEYKELVNKGLALVRKLEDWARNPSRPR